MIQCKIHIASMPIPILVYIFIEVQFKGGYTQQYNAFLQSL